MKDDRKEKLTDLGAEALAEALLELAALSDAADDLVERLIATPKENVQRFRAKISGLNRLSHFINWRGVSRFSRELEMLLQDLKAGVTDPLTGVELVAEFFKADSDVLGHCDDSSGLVGDVFRFNAKKLFVEYASRCSGKEKVAGIILRLNLQDDYGVRDALIDCAGECLTEPVIRAMITELQKRADDEEDEYKYHHHLMLIQSLARQIKDARLFEQIRLDLSPWGKLPTAACIDIARVYLESGDDKTASSWLDKIPEGETFMASERNQLLMEIYRGQGDDEKLSELLYRKFRSYRSTQTLQELLDVIGSDKWDEVVGKEVALILESSALRESDAIFLVSVGKIDEAEEYILNRSEHLDGDCYGSLLSLVEAMENENRSLAATLIYRSLLLSILERGYTKAYPHGVRYLKKLDKLSVLIAEWKRFDHHEAFKDLIYQEHGRKRSFWAKYGGR